MDADKNIETLKAAKIFGDYHYQAPIYEMAKLFRSKDNLFQYKINVNIPFDYQTHSVPSYNGAGHASDLFYLFDRPISHNYQRFVCTTSISENGKLVIVWYKIEGKNY